MKYKRSIQEISTGVILLAPSKPSCGRRIMDREEIIRMAREVADKDKVDPYLNEFVVLTPEELERFAALVAAAEREACAKVCDVLAVHPEYASDITKVAAQAIRARGKQ
jgi:hypothetical protein